MFVIYSSAELTRSALGAVAALTQNLSARVALVAVQIVPFPLPLDRPAVPSSFLEQELKAVARGIELPVEVHVVMARDPEVGIERVISPGSLVVFATKRRWWPTPQKKLARWLARAGHSVALLEV
ncbi:MAG: hypothetical protein LAP39_08225 [Acidobacteriia bacterium]|nr:hypothetical protein [Terriglobia bacterium]